MKTLPLFAVLAAAFATSACSNSPTAPQPRLTEIKQVQAPLDIEECRSGWILASGQPDCEGP